MLNDEFEEGQRHSGTKAHSEEKIFPQMTPMDADKNRAEGLRCEGWEKSKIKDQKSK